MTLARSAGFTAIRQPSLFFALTGLLCGTSASAQPPSTDRSNLSDGHYPAMQCEKPVKPFTPMSLTNASDAALYRVTVERYNQNAQAYTACVNTYLETATADVQRIQQQMDAAVAAANTGR